MSTSRKKTVVMDTEELDPIEPESNKDHYSTLGLTHEASEKEIKSARRKMASKHRPDVNPNDVKEAEARMKDVNEAYDVLSNPETRKLYDQYGSDWERYAQTTGSPDGFDEEAGAAESADVSEVSATPSASVNGDSVVTDEAVAASVDGGSVTSDGRYWFVIHTYSGYENKVKKNLEHRIQTLDMSDRIFRVEVPTVEEIEIKGGQRHPVQRKIFPGYVLVEMIMDDESWYVVRNTPGVTGFVGMGNKPTPLPADEASGILKQMTTAAPTKFKMTLQPGQAVKITDGPFADFEGIVDNINQEKGKVRVRVSMFGRETPIELDFLQVEKLV